MKRKVFQLRFGAKEGQGYGHRNLTEYVICKDITEAERSGNKRTPIENGINYRLIEVRETNLVGEDGRFYTEARTELKGCFY
jgi:phage antirepressor YoqD-like protein